VVVLLLLLLVHARVLLLLPLLRVLLRCHCCYSSAGAHSRRAPHYH